mmetsp:Transcript_9466/g.25666  ORF Transcript_9466/g.25666 Transcript_9466/m.25666 type:complete len:350 (-) Transcript_9466:21-1070(-)
MAQGVSPLDTAHREPLHAAQLDHHGRRLATASADHCVRVWDVETRSFVTELNGHEGPVWAVAWSHPMFGPLLASTGEDRCVLVWQEAENEWLLAHRLELQGPSMGLAFSPWEYGLQLVAASCDGSVTVLSYCEGLEQEERWRVEAFRAHEGGVFAVCWAPATSPAVLNSAEPAGRSTVLGPRRLVTGGADSQVRIWRHDELTDAWVDQHHFPTGEHGDWVRDVAWRPNVGIPANTIASCAEDGTVVIWTQAMVGQPWGRQAKWPLGASAWQLSWSATGSILAVADSNNQVALYKEAQDGSWEEVDAFEEEGPDGTSGALDTPGSKGLPNLPRFEEANPWRLPAEGRGGQ